MRLRSCRTNEDGQAVAEFAAALPLFVLFLVLIIEVGMVMFQQLALENVAREGARAAATTASVKDIRAAAMAASDLPKDHLRIEIGQRPDPNGMVRITASFESRIVEPLSGSVLFRPQLEASAAMKVEEIVPR